MAAPVKEIWRRKRSISKNGLPLERQFPRSNLVDTSLRSASSQAPRGPIWAGRVLQRIIEVYCAVESVRKPGGTMTLGKVVVDPDIASFRLSRFFELLLKCRKPPLHFRIVFRQAHQRADPSYLAWLLRARGERLSRSWIPNEENGSPQEAAVGPKT